MKRTKQTESKRKPYTLTPNSFFSNDERHKIMKTCREFAELDMYKGRTTWPVRFMLVDLAMFTGLRVAEIAALKVKDLHLEGEDPYLIVSAGKGNKTRTVYFDLPLKKHLQAFLNYKHKTLTQSVEPDAPLFTGHNGNVSPPITLMKSFKKAVEVAGLRKNLSIHNARHTYATFLYHDTRNLKFVQKQLGHSNINMTSLYADILPKDNGVLAKKIQRDAE